MEHGHLLCFFLFIFVNVHASLIITTWAASFVHATQVKKSLLAHNSGLSLSGAHHGDGGALPDFQNQNLKIVI